MFNINNLKIVLNNIDITESEDIINRTKLLKYLKSEEQNKAWLEVYKTMRGRYMLGMILGCIAAIPIGNSLC